ncbi:TerC family protein, partial [Methylobacterium sp. E-041]|nr:TerC family protein [Methylobacterium sp. E-041]
PAQLSAFIRRSPLGVRRAPGLLIMTGMTLMAEGVGAHVPKGYIYTAMAFSAGVEGLNLLVRRRRRT